MTTLMPPQNFKLEEYFSRIGYKNGRECTLENLKEMMRCQLYTIPFENVDVWHYKKIVSLEPAHIVEKLVHTHRGGYCYELNGLFCMALESLGYEYEMLAARPRYNYTSRRPRTHMVLLVHCEGEEYLCDLGFGGYGLRAPINLKDLGVQVPQNVDKFMLVKEGEEFVLQVLLEGKFADLYSFTLEPQEWVDYSIANYFNSTSKETVFTNKKIAILQKEGVRLFLIDEELKSLYPDRVEKSSVQESEYFTILRECFGLEA